MLVKTKNFSDNELATFERYQKLSYKILQKVADNLKQGDSEKETARKLVREYRKHGVKSFFHLPVVLFGDRTALPGNWGIGHFFPKTRVLSKNDSVIFDAAPLFEGFLVDTSYSFCYGENSEHKAMMLHLSNYRDSILAQVNEGLTFKTIADRVHHSMREHGYEPVHQKHPGNVLGHRAIKTLNLPFRPRSQGFDAMSLAWFKMKDSLAMNGYGKRSPLWNSSTASDHPPHDGLWLVEPHAAKGNVGAKWEEILVIEAGHARWLQDTPPHVIAWESR